MSTFETFVSALKGKEIFLMVSDRAVKGTITKVNDDLVIFKPAAKIGGAEERTLHFHHVVVATA